MIKGNEISLSNEIIKIVHVLKILKAEKTLKSPHLMVKNCFVDFTCRDDKTTPSPNNFYEIGFIFFMAVKTNYIVDVKI